MKITVKPAGKHKFTLFLPTGMIFCPTLLHFWMRIGRKYTDSVPDIPKEKLKVLSQTIKQVKRRCRAYELVHIESNDGHLIRIIL